MNYLNWGSDYPNSHGGKENCIAKDQLNGYLWKNYECEETLGFICETLAGTDPVTTDTPPTLPPRIPCGNDHTEEWIKRPGDDDNCYAFYGDYSENHEAKSWKSAEADCLMKVRLYYFNS